MRLTYINKLLLSNVDKNKITVVVQWSHITHIENDVNSHLHSMSHLQVHMRSLFPSYAFITIFSYIFYKKFTLTGSIYTFIINPLVLYIMGHF